MFQYTHSTTQASPAPYESSHIACLCVVNEQETKGLTLYCTPPHQSWPWARLWSRLWSPLSWLRAWPAHFPAAAHSFHCIVSDRKEQSALDTITAAGVIKLWRVYSQVPSQPCMWPYPLMDWVCITGTIRDKERTNRKVRSWHFKQFHVLREHGASLSLTLQPGCD